MGLYLGVGLVAFATLALQVCLTRLLSVTTWYHLAFFAIGAAMLGMTAGAIDVFFGRERYRPERVRVELGWACVRAGLAIPASLVVLCLILVPSWPTLMSALALLVATAAAFVPFRACGVAIALVLTRAGGAVNRLYAADLAGAALGCLFVLGALERLDVCSVILLCSALVLAGGAAFTAGHANRLALGCGALALVVAGFALLNARSVHLIRPTVVKGEPSDAGSYVVDRWNSFSRITVTKASWTPPRLWGPSAKAPTEPVVQQHMWIDGDAGTTLRRFTEPADIDHLRYDVTNVGYYLRPSGGACIIGVGGGRDLQSALLFGHQRVLGVEVNPIFVELLRGEGSLAGLVRPEVELVVDEARSYLSHHDERFALLQMSLIDTWAATGAGAFALTENALYTREAWRTMLARLKDDGIFTVSRWFDPDELGETGRLMSLAVTALRDAGCAAPAEQLVLVTRNNVCTLLLCARPFGADELARLDLLAAEHEYTLAVDPRRPPASADLRRILGASLDELMSLESEGGLRYDPPTDDAPYFFNMLSLRALQGGVRSSGVVAGNIRATRTLLGLLICLLLLTLATIVVPLVGRGRDVGAVRWSAAAYFSLIGAGFMLLEIALIQRLSVLLGHPTYALGILLFTMIASTGVGSLVSERLPLREGVGLYLMPLVAVGAIVGANVGVGMVTTQAITSPMATRIALSVALIAPLGLILGTFFPTGMALVQRLDSAPTPWYWALNGAFGVLCSSLAVLVSIFAGISANFWLAAGCYALLLPCLAGLRPRGAAAA